MIEKLKIPKSINWDDTPVGLMERHKIIGNLYETVNELVDAVNEIKQYLDCDEISGENTAENCKCAKSAYKSDLEEALEGFPGLFKSNKDEPLVDAVAPISMLDIFNEMQSLYSSLWNKLEDIHHELRKEQQ